MKKHFIWIALLLLLLLLAFVGYKVAYRNTYRMSSAEMQSTINKGDHVVIDDKAYKKVADIKRWDIVIYLTNSEGANVPVIRRVVGLPGEKIEWSNKGIKVNDQTLNLPAELSENLKSYRGPSSGPGGASVPSDSVFVIGDSADASDDSRKNGPVPFGAVEGKAITANGRNISN